MQVTAISPAFTGTERKSHANVSDEKAARHSFDEFLQALKAANAPAGNQAEEETESLLKRVLKHMEMLLGVEEAKSLVNEDGTINLARYTQAMSNQFTSGNTQPYNPTNRSSYSSTPQVVNMVA